MLWLLYSGETAGAWGAQRGDVCECATFDARTPRALHPHAVGTAAGGLPAVALAVELARVVHVGVHRTPPRVLLQPLLPQLALHSTTFRCPFYFCFWFWSGRACARGSSGARITLEWQLLISYSYSCNSWCSLFHFQCAHRVAIFCTNSFTTHSIKIETHSFFHSYHFLSCFNLHLKLGILLCSMLCSISRIGKLLLFTFSNVWLYRLDSYSLHYCTVCRTKIDLE